jgi:Tfp pilus assembly protein PilN
MVTFGRKSAVAEPGGVEAQPIRSLDAVTSAPQAAFPRVNLIPDQIAQEARVHQAKQVLVGAVAASAVVVCGLYFMAAGQVSSAQDQLDATTARSASLASEAAKYADVPKVQSDLQSARAQQALALGGEVRWSTLLNNLGLTVPQGVSLVSFKGTITGTTGATAAGSTTQGVTSALGNPGIGTVAYEGEALDNTRVAAFLDAMARNTGIIDPFATQASAGTSNGPASSSAGPAASQPKSVTFTANATIGTKALSHRYDAKGN